MRNWKLVSIARRRRLTIWTMAGGREFGRLDGHFGRHYRLVVDDASRVRLQVAGTLDDGAHRE